MPLLLVEAKDNLIGNLLDNDSDYEKLDGNLLNNDFEDNEYQRKENEEDDLHDMTKTKDNTSNDYIEDDDSE